MIGRAYLWGGAVAGFVLVLLYVAVSSAPPGPPADAEHSARRAAESCEEVVGREVPEARFPFSGTAIYLGEERYRVQGTVDGGVEGEVVRRNYECVIRYVGSGGYRADSLQIWQSH